MRSLVLALAVALPAVTASAAPITTDPHPSTLAAQQAHHSKWIRLSFSNRTMQGRVLTVGENNYLVPAGKTVNLYVTAGSSVTQSSPWNSHIGGQLLQVTAADSNRTVVLE